MDSEFSVERVTTQVLEHLERRRDEIVDHDDRVRAEVKEALVPIKKAYAESELPKAYFDGVETEVLQTVPAAWQAIAQPYTDKERQEFRLWRGGDPVARITYVFLALVIGGLCVELPFIPIWEKWFPFVLAASAWWLPDAQVRWHKRRYARALGGIVANLAKAQPLLEGRVSTEELLLSEKGEPRE
jgi:hypothetical protein